MEIVLEDGALLPIDPGRGRRSPLPTSAPNPAGPVPVPPPPSYPHPHPHMAAPTRSRPCTYMLEGPLWDGAASVLSGQPQPGGVGVGVGAAGRTLSGVVGRHSIVLTASQPLRDSRLSISVQLPPQMHPQLPTPNTPSQHQGTSLKPHPASAKMTNREPVNLESQMHSAPVAGRRTGRRGRMDCCPKKRLHSPSLLAECLLASALDAGRWKAGRAGAGK